jgi:gamma-glutamylcyclotransferase (GGCT)/AIG2-like uncharacterized protein YtfP
VALIFLNGGAMRGGPLHDKLKGARLVRTARSAARYKFYSVRDEFPAMDPAGPGDGPGCVVLGEVYDIPLETLRDHLLPAEPPELELSVIELEGGTACLATVLRHPVQDPEHLLDISEIGDWRVYLSELARVGSEE